jgi:KUP system potassium uptake protein
MEAAYGLSITVTMLMTTVLVIFWLWRNRVNKILIAMFAMVYFAIELGF